MIKEPVIIEKRKMKRAVRKAFDIKKVTPEERAKNFAEASKLVKAYERYLKEGKRLTTNDLLIFSD